MPQIQNCFHSENWYRTSRWVHRSGQQKVHNHLCENISGCWFTCTACILLRRNSDSELHRISVILPVLLLLVRMMESEKFGAWIYFKECSECTKVSDGETFETKIEDLNLLNLSCGDKTETRDTEFSAANCGIVDFAQCDSHVKRGIPTSRENHPERHVVWIIRDCKLDANSMKRWRSMYEVLQWRLFYSILLGWFPVVHVSFFFNSDGRRHKKHTMSANDAACGLIILQILYSTSGMLRIFFLFVCITLGPKLKYHLVCSCILPGLWRQRATMRTWQRARQWQIRRPHPAVAPSAHLPPSRYSEQAPLPVRNTHLPVPNGITYSWRQSKKLSSAQGYRGMIARTVGPLCAQPITISPAQSLSSLWQGLKLQLPFARLHSPFSHVSSNKSQTDVHGNFVEDCRKPIHIFGRIFLFRLEISYRSNRLKKQRFACSCDSNDQIHGTKLQ